MKNLLVYSDLGTNAIRIKKVKSDNIEELQNESYIYTTEHNATKDELIAIQIDKPLFKYKEKMKELLDKYFNDLYSLYKSKCISDKLIIDKNHFIYNYLLYQSGRYHFNDIANLSDFFDNFRFTIYHKEKMGMDVKYYLCIKVTIDNKKYELLISSPYNIDFNKMILTIFYCKFKNIEYSIDRIFYKEVDPKDDTSAKVILDKKLDEIYNIIDKITDVEYFKNNIYQDFVLISEKIYTINLNSLFYIGYCANCRKNHIYLYKDIEDKNLTCGVCGCEITRVESQGHIETNDHRVFNDLKENGKYKISTMKRLYLLSDTKKSIYSTNLRYKIIFNTDTNKTYFYTRENNKKTTRIINNYNYFKVSYINGLFDVLTPFSLDELNNIANDLYNIFKDKINFSKEELESIVKEKTDRIINNNEYAYYSALINTYAVINSYNINFTKEFFLNLNDDIAQPKVVSYAKSRYIKDGNYFSRTLKTTKAERKLIFNNPWKVTTHLIFKDCFNDKNNELKILKNVDLTVDDIYNLLLSRDEKEKETNIRNQLIRFLPKLDRTNYSNITGCRKANEYMKYVINRLKQIYVDENILTNKIIKSKNSQIYLLDICRMIYKIDDEKWETMLENILSNKYSIKRTHDIISTSSNAYRKPNREIPIDEEELKLECKMNDYKFKLARTTYELSDIGNLMNICVGSYDMSALNKACTIVYVTDSEECCECCIELRGKDIRQAKTSFNNIPTGKLKDTILKWAKDNNLNVCTSDLIDITEVKEKSNNLIDINQAKKALIKEAIVIPEHNILTDIFDLAIKNHNLYDCNHTNYDDLEYENVFSF